MQPPVSFLRAGIGRHSLPAPSPATIQSASSNGARSIPDPKSVGPTHCEPSRSYSVEPGAVKFGDKPNSHVTLQKLWLRNGLPKNFSMQFDFRTHYPNGLFFLFPVSFYYNHNMYQGFDKLDDFSQAIRPKQNHYFMLALKNSHLEITFANPKKEQKIKTRNALNDGQWHQVIAYNTYFNLNLILVLFVQVEIIKFDQRVQLLIDGIEVDRRKVPKRLNILSTAYVGGLPETNSGGILTFQQASLSPNICTQPFNFDIFLRAPKASRAV